MTLSRRIELKVSWRDRIFHINKFPRWLSAPLVFGQHAAIVEFLVLYYCRHSNQILDLGARRSPYTKGLHGLVVGVDLPSADNIDPWIMPQEKIEISITI